MSTRQADSTGYRAIVFDFFSQALFSLRFFSPPLEDGFGGGGDGISAPDPGAPRARAAYSDAHDENPIIRALRAQNHPSENKAWHLQRSVRFGVR